MLTLQEIMDVCECSEEEIAAIAMHEHIPDVVAAEMGEYLLHTPDGVPMIRKIILEDIEMARNAGRTEQVEQLELVLKHFIANHPEYRGSTNTVGNG